MLRWSFLTIAVGWAAALPAAPFAATRPQGSDGYYAFAFATYALGSIVCHQLPSRSLHLWAVPWPVCARCTGIYFGAAVAAVVAVVARLDERGSALERTRLYLLSSVLPTAATLVYEWTTGHTPSNWVRAAAGCPIGVLVTWTISVSGFRL